MILFAVSALVMLAHTPASRVPTIVGAPDAPVRLERARIVDAAEGEPPVLLYAASNVTDQELEQFTVMAFIFDAQGKLKARQVAPGRRTLEAHATKYSTMVLDGSPIEATDLIVIGVNQAQRANSETWWRTDLQASAEEAVKRKDD